MNQPQLFEYLDFKPYLSDWIRAQKNHGYGMRSRLARVLKCSRANVTKILAGRIAMSLEQAERLSTYLRHSPDERRYFMSLVAYVGAGSAELKSHFANEMAALRAKNGVAGSPAEGVTPGLISQIVLRQQAMSKLLEKTGCHESLSIEIEESLFPEVERIIRGAIQRVEALAHGARPGETRGGRHPFVFLADFFPS